MSAPPGQSTVGTAVAPAAVVETTTTCGAKRTHTTMASTATAAAASDAKTDVAQTPASAASAEESAPKRARLEVQCMSSEERLALEASLAANPRAAGERVCVRSEIEVDALGCPLVHLSIFTPTAASRAAAKEAKYQHQRLKFQEKKLSVRARHKADKVKAREERERFEKGLHAAGKTKEEVAAAMRERAALLRGGKDKRAGRHVQEVKRSITTRMRAHQLQRVVVDCSFDHLMRMEETCSLAKQIRFMYGHNLRSEKPLHLAITSLAVPAGDQPPVTDHFEDLKADAAARTQAEPATDAAAAASSPSAAAAASTAATAASSFSADASAVPVCYTRSVLQRMDGFERCVFDRTTASYGECFPASSVVYLTAESPNVVQKLDPSKVYIIGGIVDHNRMKGLCHSLALAGGIATARLPIPEYLVNDRRTVITVNQVFEILLRIQERDDADWPTVFKAVLPARSNWQERKGADQKSNAASAAAGANADDEEMEDNDQANEARMDEDEDAEPEEE